MKTKLFVLIFVLFSMSSFAQDVNPMTMPKYGRTPEDSIQCLTNLSLYRESFKQWKQNKYKAGEFDNSYQYWKWCFDNCPKCSQNIYVDGTTIIGDKISSAENESIKQAYIDTLMMVYDQRLVYFGGKNGAGNILGRKGLDLLKYRPDSTQAVYNILRELVDEDGNQSKDGVLDALFRIAIQLYKNETAEKDIILDNYDVVMSIIDYNIANNAKDKEKYVNVKGSIESAFEPFASCEDLIPLYTKKFEESPEDVALLEKISYMLDNKGCTSSELFEKVSIQYHSLNPSPESAFMLGKMMYKKENYEEAIKYLSEAVAMADLTKVYNAYYVMAACYRVLDNYPKAREMAYRAADYDTDNGEPLLFIGDLYGQSASKCSGSTLVEKNCIYWVAVDMFNQAKRVDPSVAEQANQRIALYSQHFPNMEFIFFSDLDEGDDYEVGCWINRKTKIRAAK